MLFLASRRLRLTFAAGALLAAWLVADSRVFAQGEGEMQFAPETVEKTGPPSATMVQAVKLYDESDYFGATSELVAVVEGKSGDGPRHRQRAEFLMAKSLYHLGFYSASLSYFEKIIQKGSAHPFFGETLIWLASLSQKLPESAGILDKVGKYTRAQIEQPALAKVRGELLYLLGRYNYNKQELKTAASLFAAVSPDSSSFARARFMEGVTQVRLGNGRAAAEAFKVVLRTAKEAPKTPEIRRFEELSLLSLARVFYSTKQYGLSVKYYDKIESDSPEWLTALFESSWAQFMRGNFSKALGNIHTLNAPYFENQFFPESDVLQAVIYWKNCLYDRAETSVQQFYAKYPALMRDIDRILEEHKDPAEMHQFLVGVRQGKAGLSETVRRLVLSVVGDKQLARALDYIDELDHELKLLDRSDPEWKGSAVAAVVLQDLTLQRSLAENTAGELIQVRLKRLSSEINDLQKQAIKVQYEIINAQKDTLEASLREEQVAAPRSGSAPDIVPDDEHEYWPFRGEYWRDELGYYRFKIASKCAR